MNTGAQLPGTMANVSGIGSEAWVNPNHVLVSDDQRATATLTASEVSNRLVATNFPFTIPSNASIDGVVITMERQASTTNVNILQIGLYYNSATYGTTKSSSIQWDTGADEMAVLGSRRDTWNALLTPDIINDSSFGCQLVVRAQGGIGEARVDAMWMTVYYTLQDDQQTPTVILRDGQPPHGAKIELKPSAARYGLQIGGAATATIQMSRSHPQFAEIGRLIESDPPPMLTIEYPDGYLPFVGFVTGYKASNGDPDVTIRARDHFVRIKQGNTLIPAPPTRTQASGELLRSILAGINSRTPLLLDVQGLKGGPPILYAQRADNGEDVVRDFEEATGWEFQFVYQIERDRVDVRAVWVERLGEDRRVEDVWQDNIDFVQRDYDVDFEKGYDAALVTPGTGPFEARQAVLVSTRGGRGPGTEGYQRIGRPLGGMRGTLSVVLPQLLDTSSAKAAAQALLDRPENAMETISFTLSEELIDRGRLALGDIRRVRIEEWGTNRERDVRIVGLDFAIGSGEIGVEAVVLG